MKVARTVLREAKCREARTYPTESVESVESMRPCPGLPKTPAPATPHASLPRLPGGIEVLQGGLRLPRQPRFGHSGGEGPQQVSGSVIADPLQGLHGPQRL